MDVIDTNQRLIIGIDTGGTFTDVATLDLDSGEISIAKTASTPDDPSLGFANSVSEALQLVDAAPDEVARVLHATTVATNLILEGKGSATAFLVTDGFKYVLEIARQEVPRGQNLFAWVKPDRPVRPENIWEIVGRADDKGVELQPLDEDAVRAAARAIRASGIGSIAISFLHSYAYPAHEQRAAELIREEFPEALISLSSDVMPVFREYERSMTTILNSYVMQSVSTYVGRLEKRIDDQGIAAPLLLMKSSGGVTSARHIRRAPVETALSGPAAGIVGANFIGESVGQRNLIGIDIGGTSADISLIHEGKLNLSIRGRVGTWPIGLPMVDLTTIGAGGGSIARVSEFGILSVGPESAGAVPGPACYRRGGVEPTVTDAHLVLGNLPSQLLDGRMSLDVEGARTAIEQRVALPLGLSVDDAARGIIDIANNHMAGAIRVVAVERGHDPRDFALLPFGGAGPLHGGMIARILGIRTMVLPPNPGVLSALGLLISDLKAEFSRTCLQRDGKFDLDQLADVFGKLEGDARHWLEEETVPPERRRIERFASLRYKNQGFELTVPWPEGGVTQASLDATIKRFHDLHERLYTFAQIDTPVEIATVRVDAIGVFPPPRLPELAAGKGSDKAIAGTVSMALETGRADVPIYDRSKLGAGDEIKGPCLLSQLDTNTVLLAGQTGHVQASGTILVQDTGTLKSVAQELKQLTV